MWVLNWQRLKLKLKHEKRACCELSNTGWSQINPCLHAIELYVLLAILERSIIIVIIYYWQKYYYCHIQNKNIISNWRSSVSYKIIIQKKTYLITMSTDHYNFKYNNSK